MATLQDEYNTCIYHVASALHRWLERLAQKHFSKVGLSPIEGFLLMTVQEAPGIMISDLAKVHQVVSSHITRMVSRSKSKGLMHIEKEGRVTTVFLTKKGLKKEAEARTAWKKLKLEYQEVIGREEVMELAHRLSLAIRKLQMAQ
jgi:DNA-binding MarR family transcriptional regulator